MTTILATGHARPLFAAMALVVTVAALVVGKGAAAQPVAKCAANPPIADAPATAASGPSDPERVCARRPGLCKALRAANRALIEAAKANRGGAYVCTSRDDQPGCGTGSPKPYLTSRNPYGNPADVEEGRRLLDWYLKNLTCEALCQSKDDAQVCERACGEGKDPQEFPEKSGPISNEGNPAKSP